MVFDLAVQAYYAESSGAAKSPNAPNFATVGGARTALFVPEIDKLVLAVRATAFGLGPG